MEGQTAGESPAQQAAPPPPGRWTPGQAALVAAVGILAVQVLLTLLGRVGLLPQSDAAALNTAFSGVCGLVAGLVGAGQRHKGRWPGATSAYRVAMWCFFLAAVHLVTFHAASVREALEERINRASEFQEKMRELKEQQKGDQ